MAKKIEEKMEGLLVGGQVIVASSDESRDFWEKNRFGEPSGKDKFIYSLVEALYLMEKEKLIVKKIRTELDMDKFVKLAQKAEPTFWVRFCVYADLRKRGYVVKTALKFGADFRVYARGIKPGEDHAKWTVLAVDESSQISWYGYAAQNRVAHSTRKKLLIGIVDAERSVTYYENKWVRP
jgi:tRNA-intron endonuclease, archaea type